MIDFLLSTGLLPDSVIRKGIRQLLKKRVKETEKNFCLDRFITQINASKGIALSTDVSKDQHYEVPTQFYQQVLGSKLKYSSGLWESDKDSLDNSEERMLELYCERAQLQNGQDILDLGCGWGSLSLYLAQKYPNSNITGLSHSITQRQHILQEAKRLNIHNIEIVTEDINHAQLSKQFDRILSVELFEHMRNYKRLFKKVSSWLKNDGFLFLHIFGHRELAYTFESKSSDDWMGRYFFKDGIMPSKDLFRKAQEHFSIDKEWTVNGTHYQKTLEAWLIRMRANKKELRSIFDAHYGKKSKLFWYYWEVFFMACAELFGFNDGNDWQVYHYLMKKSHV